MYVKIKFGAGVDIHSACSEAVAYKNALNKIAPTSDIDVYFSFNGTEVTTVTGDVHDMVDDFCKEVQKENF